jgi:hypothetical protein
MNSPQKRLLGPGVSRWMTAIMLAVLLAVSGKPAAASSPDPVLEWIEIMNETVVAGGTTPLVTTRVAAMVSASAFDAVNGIEQRYPPQFVRPDAQHPASQRAAAIQAAYAILLHVYPAQSASLTAHRNASLAALNESAPAINNGVNWGQRVADGIWNLRLSDGNAPPPPPFLGANVVGVWRPTPPLNASGAGPQYATMTPWVLTRPSLFRLPAPPALDSTQYQADLNEINTMGILSGSGGEPRSDGPGGVLERQYATLLESYCRTNFGGTGTFPVGECPFVRGIERVHGRCGDCLLGRQVPVCFLASHHRDPHWERWDRSRPGVGTLAGCIPQRDSRTS